MRKVADAVPIAPCASHLDEGLGSSVGPSAESVVQGGRSVFSSLNEDEMQQRGRAGGGVGKW